MHRLEGDTVENESRIQELQRQLEGSRECIENLRSENFKLNEERSLQYERAEEARLEANRIAEAFAGRVVTQDWKLDYSSLSVCLLVGRI